MTRRHRLARRHRKKQAGLTLVELLLAVAITVVISGFVVQGIVMARQAMQRDAVAEHALQTDGAVMAVASLIEAALPVVVETPPSTRKTIAFQGGDTALHFVALGNGFALEGGLTAVTVRRDREAVVVEVTPLREGQTVAEADDPRTRTVRLPSSITDLHFRYFGRRARAGAADWQDEWRDAEGLPELVAMRVDNGPAAALRQPLVMALRQR